MKVDILFDKPGAGDISPDHADVLYQVKSIRDTLISMGHECAELGFTANLEDFSSKIIHSAPDLVFNLVESVDRKGSLIYLAPAILDTLNIPYTGSKTDTIYRTSNKLFAKEWLRAKGIPTPDYFSLHDLKEGDGAIRGEYIIKSVWEHASIGLDDHANVFSAKHRSSPSSKM